MVVRSHQRINERLRSYWDELRGQRPMPDESEIDPQAIADIWDSCFLLHAEQHDGQIDYKYSYLGEAIIEAYGDDAYAREMCERLAYPANQHLLECFDKVFHGGQPLLEESQFTNKHGMIVKFRFTLLPLAARGEADVQYILGGMKWKAL